MGYMKQYAIDCGEEVDFLTAEIIRRRKAIATMWDIDKGKVLYDAVSPLMAQLMGIMHDISLLNHNDYDPYEAACQCLGHEITDCLVAEHIRRQHCNTKRS